MKIKYYENKPNNIQEKSIFLAGPSPRTKEVKSWRPEAIKILKELGFNGAVYVPENGKTTILKTDEKTYLKIFNWELFHLNKASLICFWVPRQMPDMPAFTTNVEFGYWIRSGKIRYGRPETAVKCKFLDCLYKRDCNLEPKTNLKELLKECVEVLKVKK